MNQQKGVVLVSKPECKCDITSMLSCSTFGLNRPFYRIAGGE